MFRTPTLVILALAISAAGCSSNKKVSPLPPPPPPTTTTNPPPDDPPPAVDPVDVAGTWYSRTLNNAVNCGLGETIDAQATVITQTDTDITLLTSTGAMLAGTVNGDIVDWTGSYDERGGTTTIDSASFTVSGDAASGNAMWSWTNGTDSCNGTMEISTNRDAAVMEVSPNSTPRIAFPITVTDGVAFINGSVDQIADDKDYYSFVAAADGVVQAELSHFDLAASNLDLEILDENSNQIGFSGTTDSFELAEAQVMAGMTYFIGVLATATPGNETYNLSIDVN